MPQKLRLALIIIGAFLVLNGTAVVAIALIAVHVSAFWSFVSGCIAAGSGGMILRAVYAHRGPAWLVRLVDE